MRKRWKKALAIVLSMALGVSMWMGEYGTVQRSVVAAADEAVASEDSEEPIRVDINKDENRKNAWSETFDNWMLGAGTSFSTTINNVTFTLSNGGTTGSGIKGALSKGILTDSTTSPRLTADGVLVNFEDGEDATGGTIKLEISGLTAGTHTLKTWHSFFDAVVGSSMTLSIDGVDVETIESITRAATDDKAYITYNQFEVSEGATVTALIRPNGDGEYNNAVLNAFAIDDVDAGCIIQNPYPKDGEGHFHPEEGLSWTGGADAISHDVYFGTDYDAVKSATVTSPEYKGNQTVTSYAVEAMNLSHMETYYWRIDEVTEKGTFKGDVLTFEVAHLAFPSAEGYGRFAKGGRGGRVIEVTNLNDSGPGSLRQAIEVEKGPRIIVFRVGGVIKLESKLTIPDDGGNVYVAGQTAPGDGITLTHYGFGIYFAKDVIIRHVRVRVGDENGISSDGMGMAGADHCIIDHCSISWTTDEGTSSREADNITFQYNIIAEALNNSVHYDADDRENTERHSFAGSISGDIGSYHHNLLVNCTGRNWSMAGGMEQDGVTYAGKLDIRNNVVYNFINRTTDGGVRRVNFVNNYYKMGEVSDNMKIFTIDGNELGRDDMQMAYVSGNMMVKKDGTVILASTDNAWSKGKAASAGKNSSTSDVRSDEPFFPSYVNTQSAEDAYNTVLENVGATMPKQDYLDTRYISETKNGTYTYTGSVDELEGIIDSQKDVGGYPKLSGGRVLKDDDHDGMPNNWEELHGLDPDNAEDRNELNLSVDGYTNLEMYLNELAGDKVVYAAYTPGEVTDEDPYEDEQHIVPTDQPTENPTEAPTDEPTDVPTDVPTETPIETPTETPTDVPTEAPTDEPTDVPTDVPTDIPTDEPTDAPTDVPTEAPTDEPTETPTDVPTDTSTETPTETPTESPAGEETEPPAGTETEPPVGEETEPPAGEETESPTGTETEPPAGTETEPPAGEETEPPAGEETEPPAGEETETPAGTETEDPDVKPSAPAGKITIGQRFWDTFLEIITFGLYQPKDTVVTITSNDSKDKIEYYIYEVEDITGSGLSVEELEKNEFKEYNSENKIILREKANIVVYARITNSYGLTQYISTDGMIVNETGTDPEPTPTVGPTQEGKGIKGDLNDDSKVDLLDAQIALKVALGINKEPEGVLIDVNEDKLVDLRDADLILRMALGIKVDL